MVPNTQEAERLWQAMQIAAAAWMKAKFARTYKRINLQEIDASMELRANEILEKLENQKLKSLRTTIGLTHLHEIYDKDRRNELPHLRYRALLRQQRVIVALRQRFLESDKAHSQTASTDTPS